jgi:hypothetical protein
MRKNLMLLESIATADTQYYSWSERCDERRNSSHQGLACPYVIRHTVANRRDSYTEHVVFGLKISLLVFVQLHGRL